MDELVSTGDGHDRIPDSDLDGLALQAALEAKLFGTPMPQVKVGRFVVLDRVGRGGMGTVFAVYDDKLDRRVALKVLKGDASEALRQRLGREAKTMARVSHPNVVPVFEVDEQDGKLFIVMEFVAGPTLREWAAAAERTSAEILDKYVQAGRGLAAAHAADVVHRDFKPENAIVGESGRVQVLDFGLARHPGESGGAASPSAPHELEAPITESGALVGTPAYMAPEQWHGDAPDHRTDQFAFCLALWEALGGARPFAGSTAAEVMVAVTEGTRTAPPRPIPSRIRRVLERGLSTEPAQRHPSMHAVIDALQSTTGSPRWVRPALIATSVAGLAGATVWSRQQSDAQLDPCVDGPAELAEVFDDERRAAIRESLAATGTSYSEDTATRVDAELARFSQEWLEQRRDACEATKVRGEQSEEVMALRLECLADGRRRLDAIADVLAEMSGNAVANATLLARGLPSLERCADADYLAATDPPIDDPKAEIERQAIRAEFAYSDALVDAGRYADGERIALGALERARSLEHPASIVEAANYVSEARFALGQRDEAAVVAREGFVLSDGVPARVATLNLLALAHSIVHKGSYHDAIALNDRALGLAERSGLGVQFEGVALFRRAEAQRDAGDAKTALVSYRECLERLETAGVGKEVLAMRVRQDIAWVLQQQGEYEEALEYSTRAVEDFTTLLGAEHPHVPGAMVSKGIVLWRLDRQDEAQALFLEALRVQKKLYGEVHPMIATTQHNLALSLVSQGRYLEAIERYQQGLQIFSEALGPEHPNVAAAHDSIGLAYQSLNRYAEALEHHEASLEILKNVHGEDSATTAGSEGHVAVVLAIQGRYEQALQHQLHVLEVEAKALGTHRSVASDHNALAEVYSGLGRYEKAREHADAALAMWDELDPENRRRGWSELARGFVDAEQGDCAAAVPRFERAVARFDAGLEPEHTDRARPSAALAICAHRAGLSAKVGPAVAEVRRIAKVEDAPAFVAALANLVDVAIADSPDPATVERAREGLAGLGLRPFEVLAAVSARAQ